SSSLSRIRRSTSYRPRRHTSGSAKVTRLFAAQGMNPADTVQSGIRQAPIEAAADHAFQFGIAALIQAEVGISAAPILSLSNAWYAAAVCVIDETIETGFQADVAQAACSNTRVLAPS